MTGTFAIEREAGGFAWWLYVDGAGMVARSCLSSPADQAAEQTPSPTLQVSGIPSDPDGDPVLVDYQVSKSSDFSVSSNIVAESGWTDETSWAVPQGSLLDGQTYWWRVQSWDVCSGDTGMCAGGPMNRRLNRRRKPGVDPQG